MVINLIFDLKENYAHIVSILADRSFIHFGHDNYQFFMMNFKFFARSCYKMFKDIGLKFAKKNISQI